MDFRVTSVVSPLTLLSGLMAATAARGGDLPPPCRHERQEDPLDSAWCFADLDGDGAVDGTDLGLVLGAWTAPEGGTSPDESGDLNADGVVDSEDLGLLLAAWGECPGFIYWGIVDGTPVMISTDQGPMETSGAIALRILIVQDERELPEIHLLDATLSLGSLPLGEDGTGGIAMVQGHSVKGALGQDGVFVAPLRLQVTYAGQSEICAPTATRCTEESPSDGTALRERWEGSLVASLRLDRDALIVNGSVTVVAAPPLSGLLAAEAPLVGVALRQATPQPGCANANRRRDRVKVKVQPIFIGTGADDPARTGTSYAAAAAAADTIWKDCCIKFEWLDPIYVNDNTLKVITMTDADPMKVPSAKKLLESRDPKGENDALEVFFISELLGPDGKPHLWGGGFAWPTNDQRLQARVVVADKSFECGGQKKPVTILAHEIGHAVGHLIHPVGNYAKTVMTPTGKNGGLCAEPHSYFVAESQCKKMLKGPLIKPIDPVEPCCQRWMGK